MTDKDLLSLPLDSDEHSTDSAANSLTDSELQRYGRLVARGEVPFDVTLPEPDLLALSEIVRCERRLLLIRFLARLIAQRLHRSSQTMVPP